MAKIYLSSTYSDVQPFQDRVRDVVRRRGHSDVSVAGDERSLEKALEALRVCDLYIGIIAWRYGDVLPAHGQSIIELELRCALEQQRDCMFLLANLEHWDFHKVDMDRTRIHSLHEQLNSFGGDLTAAKQELRQFLMNRFSVDELRTLMSDLGEDIEKLPPGGSEGIAREMIDYFERRGQLPQLIGAAKRRRSRTGLPLILYRFLPGSMQDRYAAIDSFAKQEDIGKYVDERLREWEQRRGITIEGQDTDWDLYRSALFEAHCWVRLQVIASSRDLITRIPLTDVFVPQLVKGGLGDYEVPKEIRERRERLFLPEQPEAILATASDDEDSDSGADLYGGLTEQTLDVLGRERMQVFLGGPGSGKSTLLLYAMLLLCEPGRSRETLTLPLQGRPVPFFVELRQYIADEDAGYDLAEYIVREARRYHPVSRDALESLLNNGDQALILLDGLDEIFQERERSQVKQQVLRFARKYPKAKLVVTSRIAGYEPSDILVAQFQHYTILDFTIQQVRQFVPKWFQYYTLKDDKRDAHGLIRHIERSSRLMELAGNPLLLTMMSVVYIREVLPERRWELYQRCTKVLLEEWDLIRHGLQAGLCIEIGEPEKAEILRRVSKYMLEHRESGPDVNVIRPEPLIRILAEYIEAGYKKAPVEARVTARQILAHLRERTYILAEIGEDRFGFVHRTFMEYFAADTCLKEFNASGAAFEHLINDLFGRHWQDDAWREVLLLLVGMLADQGTRVRQIVDHLWHQCMQTIPSNIVLAAHCLAESRQIEDQAWAQELLLELVVRIANHAPRPRQDLIAFVADGLSGFAALAPLVEIPAQVHEVIGRLQDTSASLRERMVAWQLGFALRSHDQRLPYAIEALADAQEAVRRGAIAALEREWPGNEQAGEALIVVVHEDRQPRVRLAALEALARSWPGNVDVLDAIEARVDQETAYTYVTAVIRYLSANWGGHPKAFQLIIRLADADRWDLYDYFAVAEAAVAGLGKGWRGYANALSWVHKLARHHNFQLRSTVIQVVSVAWRDDPSMLAWLKERAGSDESLGIRRSAIQAIAVGWRDDPATLVWLKEQAASDESLDICSSAMKAVAASWRNDPRTLVWLKERAVNEEASHRRAAAIEALAKYWHNDPATLAWLKERAASDPAAVPWFVRHLYLLNQPDER